jgi:cystathionine beta-lyase/cystathionine gamma-synthase
MASDQRGEHTRAVHLPPAPVPAQQPLGTPVYRTAAFAFSSSAEYAALLNGEAAGYSYSRIDNPTADAFAIAVAALEGHRLDSTSLDSTSLGSTSLGGTSLDSTGRDGPTAAQAFASGMSAISTVFWTFTGTGGHVVAPAAVYGGTYGFLRHVAARFGVQTDFVDVTDTDQVRAAMRPETAIVYAETVANPTTAVADLPALAEIAHAHGALLVVDSTMAPPVICRPLEHGADLVLHSATKYLGGHSDTTGGVVSGAPGLISQVRAVRIDTGGALAPDEAFLLRRGLETLPLRVGRQCSTAMLFATAVARHPAVRRVDYPGLPGHPGHQTAIRLFDAGPEGTRFGAIVTVTPHGGWQAGFELADRLRVGQVATSLGGTHTVVSHVASTTHRQFDDAALNAAGMDPGAVRFSIGLEDAEDLIADVHQALDEMGGTGPGGRSPAVPSRGTTPGAPGPRESPARGEHTSGEPPLAGESRSREEPA